MLSDDIIAEVVSYVTFEERRRLMTVAKKWALICLRVSRVMSPYPDLYDVQPVNYESYLGGCRLLQLLCIRLGDTHLIARYKPKPSLAHLALFMRLGYIQHCKLEHKWWVLKLCAENLSYLHNVPISDRAVEMLLSCNNYSDRIALDIALCYNVPEFSNRILASLTDITDRLSSDHVYYISPWIFGILCDKGLCVSTLAQKRPLVALVLFIEAAAFSLYNVVNIITNTETTIPTLAALINCDPLDAPNVCCLTLWVANESIICAQYLLPSINRIIEGLSEDIPWMSNILTHRVCDSLSKILNRAILARDEVTTGVLISAFTNGKIPYIYINRFPVDRGLLDKLIGLGELPPCKVIDTEFTVCHRARAPKPVYVPGSSDDEMLRELIRRSFLLPTDLH